MKIEKITTSQTTSPENKNNLRRRKLGAIFSDPPTHDVDFDSNRRHSDAIFYSNPNSTYSSPYNNNNFITTSPWTQISPYTKSPWTTTHHEIIDSSLPSDEDHYDHQYGLIGSLLREEGHIYSLAAAGDLLYTGSDSKNLRVWRKMKEFSGFRSSSGLVKAIVLFGDKVFTGHQDGKIRVWRNLGDEKNTHKRVGNLPTTRDLLIKSFDPRSYVEVRRHKNVPWVKHFDAVSCLSVDAVQGLLYSGSWDKTVKVWRISDSKCLESIKAHDDAVNAVVVGFDGLVFTGSADGSVKAWRRGETRHVLVDVVLEGDHAVTSLAVSGSALYAGSSDGLVSFWEREGKGLVRYGGVLRGHKMAVLCVAVGGEFLVVSGSADRSMCVWRREGGGVGHACLAVLTGHGGPVKCLAVEQDEDEDEEEDRRWIVYSGSLDKSVKVWRVAERALSLKELRADAEPEWLKKEFDK